MAFQTTEYALGKQSDNSRFLVLIVDVARYTIGEDVLNSCLNYVESSTFKQLTSLIS